MKRRTSYCYLVLILAAVTLGAGEHRLLANEHHFILHDTFARQTISLHNGLNFHDHNSQHLTATLHLNVDDGSAALSDSAVHNGALANHVETFSANHAIAEFRSTGKDHELNDHQARNAVHVYDHDFVSNPGRAAQPFVTRTGRALEPHDLGVKESNDPIRLVHGDFTIHSHIAGRSALSTQHIARSGVPKLDPFKTDVIKDIEWQWMNNPESVLNAMRAWFSNHDAALAILLTGQEKNPGGQTTLKEAARTLPDFWDLVSYQTSGKADVLLLGKSLEWQFGHEWLSLNSSREAWNAQPRNEKWAYFNLLWGQRQNWEDLRNYRACWKQDKAQVMNLVEQVWKK